MLSLRCVLKGRVVEQTASRGVIQLHIQQHLHASSSERVPWVSEVNIFVLSLFTT